jgi:hypothetical protein
MLVKPVTETGIGAGVVPGVAVMFVPVVVTGAFCDHAIIDDRKTRHNIQMVAFFKYSFFLNRRGAETQKKIDNLLFASLRLCGEKRLFSHYL